MLIFSIISLLLSNAVTLRRDKSIIFNRVGITILSYSSLLALGCLFVGSLARGIGIYSSLFNTTSITQTFHIFIFILSSIVLSLSAFYPRKVFVKEHSSLSSLLFNNFVYYRTKITNKMGEQFKIIEYTLVLLFIIIGSAFLISSNDLVSIFISIELQSYGLYILCTMYRNSELATSGGLTYFLLGGLSSCFILLGTGLLYSNSGNTNLECIYIITSISEEIYINIFYWYLPNYINMSLLILSVGFLFKVSAAPFHFWSPYVYDVIPTIVTTFVGIIAKISIFIFLLELVHYTSKLFLTNQFNWTSGLLTSALFSLIIGTVLGLTEFRIKRLLAYSTISHVGFILLALSINSIESIQAFIFYLIQYSLSNLNAFIILISIGYSFYFYVHSNKEYQELSDKNNSPIQLISQMKGFFKINPILSLSFGVTIFSFVGIPPLIGFFAKQMVLSAALDSGYVFITIVAILTSVISAVYYLNLIKHIFFDILDYTINPEIENISMYASINSSNHLINKLTFKYNNIILSSNLTISISILTLVILLFIFMPQEWLNMANILALLLFNA